MVGGGADEGRALVGERTKKTVAHAESRLVVVIAARSIFLRG